MDDRMLTAKTLDGIKLADLKRCLIASNIDLPDWKIKAGKNYKIKFGEYGACIYTGGFLSKEQIDLVDLSFEDLINLKIIKNG